MHDIKDLVLDDSLEYVKIDKDLYWVDDVNSKYYNKLVNINEIKKDFKSAEHLIEYVVEYEYGIEIKTNPSNVKGNGSAIFIHCNNGRKTAGCVAIPKEKMIELLKNINKDTKIIIK